MTKEENNGEANLKKTFYSEMDRVRIQSRSTLGIILFILFTFFTLGITLLYVTKDNPMSLSDYLSALHIYNKPDKTKNVPKSGEGIIRVDENTLKEAIKISDPSFPLKKADLSITGLGIIISGKTNDSILGLKVAVKVLPKVENEKLTFKIEEIKSSGVSVPKSIVDQISSPLNSVLNNAKIIDGKVKETRLFEKYLELELVQ
jgi:hypothetical protein